MSQPIASEAPTERPKEASPAVIAQQQAMREALPFSDTADFDDAARGFLGTIEHAKVTSAAGRMVWNLEPYGFLSASEAPPTVNPSLWRQSRLNMHHGLFEVVPGVYQVRGFDIANMTLIEGDRGVIVVDTLNSIDGAARSRSQPSSSPIPTPTIGAARAASSPKRPRLPAASRSSRPICSWNMRFRKTSSPAPP